jgi:selenide,water dikinase
MEHTETTFLLTEYSRGAGCGCKIAPAVLEEILHNNKALQTDDKLWVGNSGNDDAAVYDMGNDIGLITTTDFFMPIVDDAYQFGCIAAANAISDVYAMGGTPLVAIAILGWPVEKLPAALAQQVLEGARSICAEAGIQLAGGHSIDTSEPIFGLSVNGTVHKSHLKKNNTAQEGDLLFLTKPIGVGILATAMKRKVLEPEHLQILLAQLTQLNKVGKELGALEAVTAMTDVTGFGLLGHLIEMAEGAGLSAEIDYSNLPVTEGVRTYLAKNIIPDATYRNWNSYSSRTGFEAGVNVMEAFSLLPDPQTNGGLLIAVAEHNAQKVIDVLIAAGLGNHITPIGRMTCRADKIVQVKK